jgi:O-antigen/teichoic acid export membrane protein
MRLFRRNALGMYAVYGAAIVSGLVVTPIVVRGLGKDGYGAWSLIGAVTTYLTVLDLGVAPAIVRYAAEARGRRARAEISEVASTGLLMYGVTGLLTLPVGSVLVWVLPKIGNVPHQLATDVRVATALIVLSIALRFPLGLFNNLLVAQQRQDLQNLGNFLSTALYALLAGVFMARGGGLVLLAALVLGATLLRLTVPLFWLRSELPELRVARRFVTRARLRQLTSFSSWNFLLHLSQKIVFSTDVIVVGIVLGVRPAAVYAVAAKLFSIAFGIGTAATSLMSPALAELQGARAEERQRRLFVSGLRGGSALMLLLAMPLMLMPDLLISAWIHTPGYHGSYLVMALLAGVLLVHAPLSVLTGYLMVRDRQRELALTYIVMTATNLALSFTLAWTWGIAGVALSTLVTDAVTFVWVVPRYAAPAAGVHVRTIVFAITRPMLPAVAGAALVLVGVARIWQPHTLVLLGLLGCLWVGVAAPLMWWLGFSPEERSSMRRVVVPRLRPARVAIESR